MESKAGEREVAEDVWPSLQKARTGHDETQCPWVLDVACLESGDLNERRRAALDAHSRDCARCGTSLAELRQARTEILGATDLARRARSQRAAEEIQNLLRHRLH